MRVLEVVPGVASRRRPGSAVRHAGACPDNPPPVAKLGTAAYLLAGSREWMDVGTPRMESMSEADLVREARGGVEEAFLALYECHRTAVFQFAWRLTGSRATADDVTQECFLTLIRG